MRTYGRVYDQNGVPSWVRVDTDAKGFDDYVWITTLAQVLLLNRGESPFYADYGIPAQVSVVQQVFPDLFVSLTQQQFSGHFAALTISKLQDRNPHYRVNVTTQQGVKAAMEIPI